MIAYVLKKITGQPDWSQIPALSMDYSYLETPKDIRAFAQICYTDEALLLHMWTEEPVIRAVEQGPLGNPCQDSCLEFFFSPMEGDPRYFNFEFNFNKCLYLGLGGPNGLTRLVPNNMDALFAPRTRKTDKGWELDYRIPSDFVRRFFPDYRPVSGKTVRSNCYTCADLTQPAHYLSWRPVPGEPLSFHRPESFGLMIFSEN